MSEKTKDPADYWGPNVRRIKDLDMLTLLCQEYINGEWVTFAKANEMANDYAYTDSSGWCRQRATKYIGRGH